MPTLNVLNSELVDYQQALEQQLQWVNARKSDELCDLLWLLSHPKVITLGASRSSRDNLLKETEIPVVKISRGGDITYHDEGQLTGYFIFQLEKRERDLHRFLWSIEQSVIDCLNDFNIDAHRVAGKTGVFVSEKKVCSIGIACRHWVTYHGFSINFNSNLENYELMNPCGYNSELMANLLKVSMFDFRHRIGRHVAKITNRSLGSTTDYESLSI